MYLSIDVNFVWIFNIWQHSGISVFGFFEAILQFVYINIPYKFKSCPYNLKKILCNSSSIKKVFLVLINLEIIFQWTDQNTEKITISVLFFLYIYLQISATTDCINKVQKQNVENLKIIFKIFFILNLNLYKQYIS